MRRGDRLRYIIIGILILTAILVINNVLGTKQDYVFLYACYVTLPLIIFGLFKKNSNIILSQIIIIAIPDLFWVFDFFYYIFSGHSPLGLVGYFPGEPLSWKIASLQHLYFVPLSLFALAKIKFKRNYKVLLFSLFEIILIFLATLLLVPNTPVNCIDLKCIIVPLEFLPPYVVWFLFTFGFTAISYFIISSLPFIRKK
jgi:hypothetical protein